MSPEDEQAEQLLRKADEDRVAMETLNANAEVADAPIGFHAQQAVEKSLKAVLAARRQDFPATHDLHLLTRRLEQSGVAVPSAVWEARRLAPWAVEYRYGEVIDEALDRPAAARLVDEVIGWAAGETQVDPGG
ncbi:MAG: HEPN domain-containing protein [Actinomycetota bacterium]|nr:HEPN domain-containing protein [Actinomycetota bacterium]